MDREASCSDTSRSQVSTEPGSTGFLACCRRTLAGSCLLFRALWCPKVRYWHPFFRYDVLSNTEPVTLKKACCFKLFKPLMCVNLHFWSAFKPKVPWAACFLKFLLLSHHIKIGLSDSLKPLTPTFYDILPVICCILLLYVHHGLSAVRTWRTYTYMYRVQGIPCGQTCVPISTCECIDHVCIYYLTCTVSDLRTPRNSCHASPSIRMAAATDCNITLLWGLTRLEACRYACAHVCMYVCMWNGLQHYAAMRLDENWRRAGMHVHMYAHIIPWACACTARFITL